MPGVEDLIGAGTSAAGGPIGMGINAVSSLASTGLGIAQFIEQKDQWNKQFEYMKDANEHFYQNKVKDLRAAGLNPLLAAGGGFGTTVGQGPTQSPISTSSQDARPSQQQDIYAKLNAQQLQAQTDKVTSDRQLVDEQIAAQHHRNVMDGVYDNQTSPEVRNLEAQTAATNYDTYYRQITEGYNLGAADLANQIQQQIKDLHDKIDPLMPANISADTYNKRSLADAATKNAATNQFTAEVNAKLTAQETLLKRAITSDQMLRNKEANILHEVNMRYEQAKKLLLAEDAEFALANKGSYASDDPSNEAWLYKTIKAKHPTWSDRQIAVWAACHMVVQGVFGTIGEALKNITLGARMDVPGPFGSTPPVIKGFGK